MPKAANSNNLNLAGDSWDSKGKHNLSAAASWHCKAGKTGNDWEKQANLEQFHFCSSHILTFHCLLLSEKYVCVLTFSGRSRTM